MTGMGAGFDLMDAVSTGTVPTLVVPTIETVGPETVSRYRSLRDTMVRLIPRQLHKLD